MKNLFSVVWWPHSGGRWLTRSLCKEHSKVFTTTYVHPWLFNSTDKMLQLDLTSQVHKARSLPELNKNLHALKSSTDLGRLEGIKEYFRIIKSNYITDRDERTHIVGEICLGSPEPKPLDISLLFQAQPDMKIIHLVRNPIDSYNSFHSRGEMDGDPIKIAGSWLTLNANISNFFTQNEQFKNQYLLIKYEDLISNTEKELKKICQFMDLEYEKNIIKNIEERWGKNTQKKTSPEISKIILNIAKYELTTYGYING